MTPREKADELRQLFAQELIDLTDNEDLLNSRIKQCALIAVDEILSENSTRGGENDEIIEYEPYWQEVQQQLIKLK